jgi:hypothetical protein
LSYFKNDSTKDKYEKSLEQVPPDADMSLPPVGQEMVRDATAGDTLTDSDFKNILKLKAHNILSTNLQQ